MEFAERRRSRKSQSYKLINEQDFEPEYFDSAVSHEFNGESRDAATTEAWLGEEGVEIKRQITGMMRLLSDKAGRVYQRVGREGENLKQEPQEEALSWAAPDGLDPEEPQYSAWSSAPTPPSPQAAPSSPQPPGQYGTRSKTQRLLNRTKVSDMSLPSPPAAAVVTQPSCCMCNCKSTLQAILQELRAMRKLLHGAQEKPVAGCSARPAPVAGPSRKRARKRRPVHRVAPLATPTRRATFPSPPPPELIGRDRRERPARERTVPAPLTLPVCYPAHTGDPTPLPHCALIRGPNSTEPEVQLAEDYEVFIPKSQLDSILVNYTRSGSLLFRKLVCAFFDDSVLANSLPNGKRKRGLNDHRKGLDQNIVGAIKVFTEKYCTANRIEKLPGPRDWVQILQDQIKLARRRLKRAETATDCDELFNRSSTDTTATPQTPDEGKEYTTQTALGVGIRKAENVVDMDTA